MHLLLATLLGSVLALGIASSKLRCSRGNQACPSGLYCDLGISRCFACNIVCDRNSILMNKIQCLKKCSGYQYLLQETQEGQAKPDAKPLVKNNQSQAASTISEGNATPSSYSHTVAGPMAKGPSTNYLDKELDGQGFRGSSDLHMILFVLLALLIIVVVVLSLGLVIAAIVYHVCGATAARERRGMGTQQKYVAIGSQDTGKELVNTEKGVDIAHQLSDLEFGTENA